MDGEFRQETDVEIPVPYRFRDLTVAKVGVIGSGQIGPDIALHFAGALHPFDVHVTVVDVATDALERGRAKVAQKIGKTRESGVWSGAAAEAVGAALEFTDDYERLRGADFVIEAATENLDVKRRIFARVAELAGADAVLASNSSHIEPDLLFDGLPASARRRALVAHYFFPADRNPVVEIVSSRETQPELAEHVIAFYESIGKLPVAVAGRYGYAVNPIFEGLFLAAALAVEEGLGTTKEVDAAARRALGLGVGPFTAMNLTGGNPITTHALDEMTSRLGPWFRTPKLLREAIAAGTPWEVPKRDETVSLPPEREARIADAMRGVYFGLCGQVLDSRIIALSDLELAVELGLAARAPFTMMNEMGLERARALVEGYACAHRDFVVPRSLVEQAASGQPFRIAHVLRRDVGDVAVITIRRPQVLNALNEAVYAQLAEHFTALRDDRSIRAVVLTGFGTKAFAAGADVQFLAGIRGRAEGVATAERSKLPGNLIEGLGKPVVAALNGFALGGGNELAMCCTARIVRGGLKLAVSQPEADLGILPGSGATQRLPRLVGVERAAEMLRAGRALSSREAVECGLAIAEVEGDVVGAAIALARRAADGQVALSPLDPAPIAVPASLPPVDIGHRSRAIDALICRAILEGCRRRLDEGLRLESELFGECCTTEDMRLGVRNFLANGPKAKAVFVHR
jgi:enoyl-CoA hydratase/3-hydroxyacyl-CoA dehydrogenase